ncbi:hypothetical protein V3589_11405 [Sinorhizobium fredii]|uniref:hypothetical protein n=1 Tax=Rhizobium fredii TaxID=380 RepID=UPI0030AC0A88
MPRKSLEQARRELQKTLERSGYCKLKAKHKKSLRPAFPDYSTNDHRERYPSVGGFGPLPGPQALPPDAKRFPVGISHKQGPMLITAADDLAYVGGKKP